MPSRPAGFPADPPQHCTIVVVAAEADGAAARPRFGSPGSFSRYMME